MMVGIGALPGRLGLNRIVRAVILPGEQLLAWARHHVEEFGNLERFLPGLYAERERFPAEETESTASACGHIRSRA